MKQLFKVMLLVLLGTFAVSCDDNKITNDKSINPLAGLCFERYYTQGVTINDNQYLGDLRVELTISDSIYNFDTFLMNTLPATPTDTNVVVSVSGFLWLSEQISDHEYTYVIQQLGGRAWNFVSMDWHNIEGHHSEWKRVTIGEDNELEFLGNTYSNNRCEKI